MMIRILFLTIAFSACVAFGQKVLPTPCEKSGQTATATYEECVQWYRQLHAAYPAETTLDSIGYGDVPRLIWVFRIRAGAGPLKRIKVLVNNNIHPGEPEGTDASMMLARDLLTKPELKELAGAVDLHIICQYNVDGTLNRSCCTRANQDGPPELGFRGNGRNLDLNRDFIKCDSRNAQAFVKYFSKQKFDFMVDNHTSDGADYQYVLTYFHTRPEKLETALGSFLTGMDKTLKSRLEKAGWPTAPYVETRRDIPDSGINAFWETGRYATGYAALHHCLGFTVETHMLKPFKNRVEATYGFMLEWLREIRAQAPAYLLAKKSLEGKGRNPGPEYAVLNWQQDPTRWDTIPFLGFEHTHKISSLTGQSRLYYDRSKPWSGNVKYYHYYTPTDSVRLPRYYIIPFAWKEVAERLQWNGMPVKMVPFDSLTRLRVSYITRAEAGKSPYEGHFVHHGVTTRDTLLYRPVYKGDYIVTVNAENYRFLSSVLEPRAPDSYFAWGFFDAVLQQKEWFSDYVWVDKAEELLQKDPALKKEFDGKRASDAAFAADARAQLVWIYRNSAYYEATHNLYPIYRLD
ncbi:MAG: hypothetical protein JNL57_03765 [Bacteroidetes bacterium]|nr:hypothetical protein [Bacteroidota bacterium]